MIRFLDPGGRVYGTVGTSNANLLAYWTSVGGGVPSIAASGGRTSGSCLRFGGFASMTKILDSQATWGVAAAVKFFNVGSAFTFLNLTDSGTSQVDVRANTDGTLSITRNGTVLGTTSISVTGSTWYHVEMKATIHPSAGAAQLWVNGVSRIGPLTGINTRTSANSTANTWVLGTPATSTSVDYDDIIFYDGQTTDAYGNTAVVGPIGDRGVLARALASDGTYAQFTPNSGTAHYSRLTETSPDGDTTYNEDATVGHRDSFNPATLPVTVTAVVAKAIVGYARKTDVGSRQAGFSWRIGSTDYDHPTAIDLTDSYLYHLRFADADPSTAAAWGLTNAGASQVGVKVVS